MILSFTWARVGTLAAGLAALGLATTVACRRSPAPGDTPEARTRAGEVIGAVKLLRQEYANGVDAAGSTVADPTEYAEAELFAEQAQAKFAAFERAVGGSERTRAIGEGLARLRTDVTDKVPPATVTAHATATLGLLDELLAGAVPDAIRGAVVAVSRADQAIAAEEVVGEYRIGITSGPPRPIFRRQGAALVSAPPAAAGALYVGALVRERRTKRYLPAAEVGLTIEDARGAHETALAEVWGDYHQYGANLSRPAEGPVTITVRVSPPAYARHGDMLTHFVTPATATFRGTVRAGVLAFDARPVAPPDPDYAIGDDVLQALTEAGEVRPAGPYRIGVIVEGPEPIWTWRDGAPVLQPATAGATNHVEVVLLDAETGQLVPSAHVTVTFMAGDSATATATLHPLLSVFSHYGETLALPPGVTSVRVHVGPPDLGAIDRPRLAEGADIELPLPGRRSA